MEQNEILIKMVLDRWNSSIAKVNEFLSELTDEQLQKEIAPRRNRGIYLLGHLIAVHDNMLILLDMGEKLYPELFEPYIKQADSKTTQKPTLSEVKTMWYKQCEFMQTKFAKTTTEDWFSKHSSVSAEDFTKEPHRNKLNIIITRTSHLQYHLGQMVLLTNK